MTDPRRVAHPRRRPTAAPTSAMGGDEVRRPGVMAWVMATALGLLAAVALTATVIGPTTRRAGTPTDAVGTGAVGTAAGTGRDVPVGVLAVPATDGVTVAPVSTEVGVASFGPVVAAPPLTAGRWYAGDCAVAPEGDDTAAMARAVHTTFLCVGARLGWLDEAPRPSPGSDAFPSRAHQHAAEAVVVAWCESALDPTAVNPGSSARGLMQVLQQHDDLFARYGTSWRDGALDPVHNLAVAADLQSWLVQRGHSPWSDWESANAYGSEVVGGPVLVGVLPGQRSVRASTTHLAAPALPAWAAAAGDLPISGSCSSVWRGGGW